MLKVFDSIMLVQVVFLKWLALFSVCGRGLKFLRGKILFALLRPLSHALSLLVAFTMARSIVIRLLFPTRDTVSCMPVGFMPFKIQRDSWKW